MRIVEDMNTKEISRVALSTWRFLKYEELKLRSIQDFICSWRIKYSSADPSMIYWTLKVFVCHHDHEGLEVSYMKIFRFELRISV